MAKDISLACLVRASIEVLTELLSFSVISVCVCEYKLCDARITIQRITRHLITIATPLAGTVYTKKKLYIILIRVKICAEGERSSVCC